MWNNMISQLDALANEARSLPDVSEAVVRAKQHIATMPLNAAELGKMQRRLQEHLDGAKVRTAQAILAATQGTADSQARLRDFAVQMVAEVETLIAEVSATSRRVTDQRALVGSDAGDLSAAAMDARARLKELERRKADLDAKSRELRDRSVWTWLFLPAKAIDELVSAIQHGKSTEAALEDTLREIDQARREATAHIRTQDICTGLAERFQQLAAGLQAVANRLSFLKSHLTSEENLAKLASPATAQVVLNAILQLLKIIETETA